jgi:hypothetical protein
VDSNQLNSLTVEQRAAYMKLERLFEQDGWKDVEVWALKNLEEATARQLNARTWDESRVAFGMRTAFIMIAALKEDTEKRFALLAEEAAEREEGGKERTEQALFE